MQGGHVRGERRARRTRSTPRRSQLLHRSPRVGATPTPTTTRGWALRRPRAGEPGSRIDLDGVGPFLGAKGVLCELPKSAKAATEPGESSEDRHLALGLLHEACCDEPIPADPEGRDVDGRGGAALRAQEGAARRPAVSNARGVHRSFFDVGHLRVEVVRARARAATKAGAFVMPRSLRGCSLGGVSPSPRAARRKLSRPASKTLARRVGLR